MDAVPHGLVKWTVIEDNGPYGPLGVTVQWSQYDAW